MEFLLGLFTLPAMTALAFGLHYLGSSLLSWWQRPVDLSKVSRNRRAHVVSIVASELAAARRMRQLRLPGNVLLAIRSGGVGTDDYGYVLLDKRMRVFKAAIDRAFDELDESEPHREK